MNRPRSPAMHRRAILKRPSGTRWLASAAPARATVLASFAVAAFMLATLPALAQPPSQDAARKAPSKQAAGAESLTSGQNLARRQDVQQQVRAMARDLVSAIVDIQLQQLEENDLTNSDLYGDIKAMRGHIDELIEAEMPRVVKLLAEVRGAAAAARDKQFVAARQTSRDILVQLLVERQRVLRRLRVAELAAQVRRLIEVQTKVLEVTQSLPEKPLTERETLTLSAVEDQRDAKAVYLRLHETIKEVSTWGGEVGTLASGALAMLQKALVDAEMESAARSLEQTRFADAAAKQDTALKALRELLKILERVQGAMKGEQQAIEQAIQALVDRQAEIREATKQADANELEQLTQQQSELQKDLDKLSQQAQSPQSLQEARQAAEEAAAKLFEGNPKEAVPQQDKVIENLSKAARQNDKEDAARLDNKLNNLAQSTQSMADLEAARRDLEKILQEQKQASAAAANQPAQAKPQENQIARELADVPRNRRLPQEVAARTAEAQQAASDAGARMEAPQPQRTEAARAAEQAIQRALSEAERALADAKRLQARDAMQAMAQAAQAVAKAAAVERDVAHQADASARKGGMQAGEAQELGQKQSDVKQTAADVAKRVEQAAPEAAKMLNAAALPIQQAAEQLQVAAQQPGESSKPAARDAATQANQAAEKLSQTAEQLNRKAAQAAERLAQLTAQQLQQAQQALQAVEQVNQNRPEPIAERMERLVQAEEHVRKAQAEELRASGRPEAARAAELAAQIEKTADKQARKALEDAAKQARAEAAKEAAAPAKNPDAPAQNRVGQAIEAARELAQADARKAAETLAEAAKTSDDAQRQMPPSGDLQKLAKAQQATAQGLQQAAHQLADAKKQLAQEAAKQMAAQARSARGLEDQAAPVDPGATGALQSAENQAVQAAVQLPQSPAAVPSSEKGVAEAMNRAEADLAARVQELKGDQALAQAVARPAGTGQQPPRPSDRESPQPADGGTAHKGEMVKNRVPLARSVQADASKPDRDSRGSVTPNADADAGRARQTEEPWLARLPPEVRAAIRANSQRRPPRGYEERLQRYYKNID